LNKKCKFPSPNGQVLFRSHAVGRKYFATCLYRNSIPQLSIEWFLGHRIDSTTSDYYKQDVQKLKEQYITCIEDLSIESTEIHTLESKEFKELKSLRSEVDELRAEIRKEQKERLNKYLD
jgi:hypothetical protein